jgi:phosphoglucomutase
VNDYWKDALLLFVAGNLAGQVKKITAYNGTTKVVTVSGGFTGTPAAGDAFVLVVI